MRLKSDNPWLTQAHYSELVSINTHSLWASIAGPIRSDDSPLLIFFTGAGASCAPYIKLHQQLSQFVRVLFYDRAGYDQSTLPPNDKIYAEDTARDLTKLLAATHLAPPYILMGHSYGGIPARSFLSLHQSNPRVITGMILIDCATELMLALFPRVPPFELLAVAKNVDWEELTHLKDESGMTDEEWDYAYKAQQRCKEGAKREDTHASAHRLAQQHQSENIPLGDRPLSVLRFNVTGDFQTLYDAGVGNGDGTEDERRAAKYFIDMCGLFHDELVRAQCGLSRDAEYAYFGDWRHDSPIRNATLMAQEIRKLVERVTSRRCE